MGLLLVDLMVIAALAVIAAWSYRIEGRRGGAAQWIAKGLLLLFSVHVVAYQVGLTAAIVVSVLGSAVCARPLVVVFRARRRLDALFLRSQDSNDARAFVEMGRELLTLRPPLLDYSAWTDHVLVAAGRALSAGYTERASSWLESIAPTALDPRHRAVLAYQLTFARLELRDWKGARLALARALRPAPADLEPLLAAQEALLATLDRDTRDSAGIELQARTALAKATGATQMIWREAHAHALAALGLREEARATLRALRAEHGDRCVSSVVGHDGPASTIAAAVLNEGLPYRA